MDEVPRGPHPGLAHPEEALRVRVWSVGASGIVSGGLARSSDTT